MWVGEIMKDFAVFAQTGYHFIPLAFCARPGDHHSRYVAVDMANISGAFRQQWCTTQSE